MCLPAIARLRLTAAAAYLLCSVPIISSAFSAPLTVAVAAAASPPLCSLPSTTLHRCCPRPCHCLQRSVLPACLPVSPVRHKPPPEASHNTQIRIISTTSPSLSVQGSLAQPCSAQFPYLLRIANGHLARPRSPTYSHSPPPSRCSLQVLPSVRLHSDNPADSARLQQRKVRRHGGRSRDCSARPEQSSVG